MHRLLRIVLVWLLVVAVPLQAGAAAGRIACAMHAGVEVASSPHHGASALADDGMPTAMHHTADHASHAHAHAHGTGPQHDGSPGSMPKAKCGACASCCVVGALPSTGIVAGGVDRGQRFPTPAHTARPAFLTAVLERPPRTSTF